jgi:serine phosphatase RsbU (regulator of sigma subunit)
MEGASFPAALWSGSHVAFTWMNQPFSELLGPGPRVFDILGMPASGFLSDAASAAHMQDVAYTGLPHTEHEYHHASSEGRSSYWELTFLPVPGRLGEPNDVLLTAIDVTARVETTRAADVEAEDLKRAIGLIDATVHSSLDSGEILQRVIVEATETFGADWGWVAERAGDDWTFCGVHGWPADMLGRTFRGGGAALPDLALRARAVVAVGCREDGGELERELMDRFDIDAFLLIPVLARGDVHAVMGFCWNCETSFGDVHHALADKLAFSLSLSLHNSRQYEAERTVSRTLQSAFFTVPEAIPGFDYGHLYHSAASGAWVGGDFYDLLQIDDGRVGMLIGDVSGHGLGVAALTSMLKGSMRAEMLRDGTPEEVVGQTSQLMLRGEAAETYASAFFGVLDVTDRRLDYVLAGHPAPVLVKDGGAAALLQHPQVLMGAVPDPAYTRRSTRMGEGDLLVMYTDGITEAVGTEGRYGEDRLLMAIDALSAEDPRTIPEALFTDVFSYAGGRLRDDAAILALRPNQAGLAA